MSFEDALSSERGPSIFAIFEFQMGVDLFFRYTDADERVGFGGNAFLPEPISYGDVTADGSLKKATLKLESRRNLPPAKMFRINPPSFESVLRIWEGNFSDRGREFRPLWQGRVLNCKVEGGVAEFSCEPKSTSLSRPGLRRNYQRPCPHAVYGDLCLAARVEQSVSWISGTGTSWTVSQPVGGYLGPETYSGGLVSWTDGDGLRRSQTVLGVSASGSSLVLGVNKALRVGETPSNIVLVKGCDHSENACTLWHNNILNFGGQVFIPTNSPINKISTYY